MYMFVSVCACARACVCAMTDFFQFTFFNVFQIYDFTPYSYSLYDLPTRIIRLYQSRVISYSCYNIIIFLSFELFIDI